MTRWHPVQTLQAVELHFPVPGTDEPFAIVRWVDVLLDGAPVSRWRAVTAAQPRELIGYFAELEEAAMACHRRALSAAIRPELNETRR